MRNHVTIKHNGMMTLVTTLLVALFNTSPLLAETLVLKNATVHTVSGETLSPGNVVVKDGKIAAVGKNASAKGAKEIDLSGQHLYPGLILSASSLGLTEINAVRASQDTTEVGPYTPDVKAWLSVNPDSELLPVARANGITHFNVAPIGGVVAGYSGVMQMRGWTMEEMTIKAPAALHLYWPQMELKTGPKELAADRSKWKSPEDQAKARDKKLREIDEFFDDAEAYRKARMAKSAKPQLPVPAWEAMLPMLEGKVYAYHWSGFVGGINPKVDTLIKQGASVADFDLIFFNNGLHSLAWTPEKATDQQIIDTTRAIVRGFKAGAPKAKLFWIATTPHTARRTEPSKPVTALGDKNPIVLRINRLAEQVMKEEGIEVIDMYTPLAARLDLAAGDEYHWTGPAYKMIADAIVAKTNEALKGK